MSRKLNKTNNKGFTLIEVVLVLAIGGLIFLLAFIAFRNASINRRDGQRRSDLSRMIAELNNYMGDNTSTTAPTSALFPGVVTKYLGANFSGPSSNAYRTYASLPAPGTIPAGPDNGLGKDSEIFYTPGDASGSKAGCTAGTKLYARDFKIEMGLEKGTACRDSL